MEKQFCNNCGNFGHVYSNYNVYFKLWYSITSIDEKIFQSLW